jgi:hypothetical protein
MEIKSFVSFVSSPLVSSLLVSSFYGVDTLSNVAVAVAVVV